MLFSEHRVEFTLHAEILIAQKSNLQRACTRAALTAVQLAALRSLRGKNTYTQVFRAHNRLARDPLNSFEDQQEPSDHREGDASQVGDVGEAGSHPP